MGLQWVVNKNVRFRSFTVNKMTCISIGERLLWVAVLDGQTQLLLKTSPADCLQPKAVNKSGTLLLKTQLIMLN